MLLALTLIASLSSVHTTSYDISYPVYELEEIDDRQDFTKLKDFLFKINEANRLVYDSCEIIDEKSGLFQTQSKPHCLYNVSYLNKSEIVVFGYSDSVRTFLISEKKTMCDKEDILCGRLTIIVKLLDLINSAIHIALNNAEHLWVNLDILDFYDLFNLYKVSVSNIELLTNITLQKQKANIILSIEKNKLRNQIKNARIINIENTIYTYFAKPLKDTTVFLGDTIGTTLGATINSTIHNTIPEIDTSYKIISGILLLLGVYIKVFK